MLLTDTDIYEILQTDRNVSNKSTLIIHPFEERCLTPVGYDIRVGDNYQLLHEGIVHELSEGETISIPPGETVSIRSMEWVAMPENGTISGLITSRVMLVASGATHISTTIDADWVGNLLISFTNNSKATIALPRGERMCSIVFLQNKSSPRKRSQHPPGRPDALNQNASRIAQLYRREKSRRYAIHYFAWILFGGLYAAFTYWAQLKYGDLDIFGALMAGGLIVVALGVEIVRSRVDR